jgi:hypothetical protein
MKITYDLLLYGAFRNLNPPEERRKNERLYATGDVA